MSRQVRSPGQVKWPYLKKYLEISPWLQFLRYQYETFNSWLSISTYKTYISEFRFSWPEVRSILKPHHYKSMGKCSYAVFFECTSGNVLFISRYSYIGPLSMTRMQFWPNDPSFRSIEVIWAHIRFFLSLAFDRIEIERWGWPQYVSLAQTHQLICNMTHLPHTWPHVTMTCVRIWPEVKFWHCLLRSICIYLDASRQGQHDAAKIMSLASLVQKLFVKNHFRKKALFWPFLTSVA